MLAGWADQQAAQGHSHTVIQWGNWTAGMPSSDIIIIGCSDGRFPPLPRPVASLGSACQCNRPLRLAGSAPDFATAHQMQQTGLGALAPAAALDMLAAVMLAAWHKPSHASPITAARIDWTALSKQVPTAPADAPCSLVLKSAGLHYKAT